MNIFLSKRKKWAIYLSEFFLICIVALIYGGSLLNPDPNMLQATGEHHESVTLSILVDQAYQQTGEYPRWNPYMMTGFPHTGDPLSQFPNPIALLPSIIYDGISGVRVSIFISLIFAGMGQLILGYVLGFNVIPRIWSAILFMISGGLAMIWRGGWIGLLNGVVWIPYCYAFLFWAWNSKKRFPVGLASIAICLLAISGHSYWLLYFIGSLFVIVPLKLFSNYLKKKSWKQIKLILLQLVFIGLLSIGLAAATITPMIDTWVYIQKEASANLEQIGSQRIIPAISNYFIHDFDYFLSSSLGKTASGSWLYIGGLPLIFLFFVTLAYKESQQKEQITILTSLVIFFIVWHANKYTPMGFIYEKIPFLYLYRFPDRLLIMATSPLIALSGYGLSYLLNKNYQLKGKIAYLPEANIKQSSKIQIALSKLILILILITLVLSSYNALRINKEFAFAPEPLDPNAQRTLSWLKEYDSEIYYINIGNWPIIWEWMPAAYQNQHKVINFEYGRILKSRVNQKQAETGLLASPKYIIAQPQNAPEETHEVIFTSENMNIYKMENILPYGFIISKEKYLTQESISSDMVQKVSPITEGPNKIMVNDISSVNNNYLILLESYYPGWKVRIDEKPVNLVKIDNYLGVVTKAGTHDYVFSFEPRKFTWGKIISSLSLLIVIGYIFSDSIWVKDLFDHKVHQ